MRGVRRCLLILLIVHVPDCRGHLPSLADVLSSGTDRLQVFRVHNDTIKFTKVQFYHLLDLDPKLPVVSLVRIEDGKVVSTMVMNHPASCERCVRQYRANSVFFVLNNFRDIMSLVADLGADRDPRELNLDATVSTLANTSIQLDDYPGRDLGGCDVYDASKPQSRPQFIDLGPDAEADPSDEFWNETV